MNGSEVSSDPAGSTDDAVPAPEAGARTSAEGMVGAVAGATPLERLAAGNRRFLSSIAGSPNPAGVTASLAGAEPYAVVLGCSDSRVPPETIFDETLGRLFVVRVAANVAGPNEIGSIEYALARWNCPLLIVLGHSQCGGIAAALDPLPGGAEKPPASAGAMHLGTLVGAIKSNLGSMGECAGAPDPWLAGVQLNVRRTVELLINWSEPVRRGVVSGTLRVVGAIYHVESGEVEFLDRAG